jgi:chaperonin cofactor prefoldin
MGNISDTIDCLLEDPEIEGKKRGFERAAEEFAPIVKKIEKKYKGIIKFLDEKKEFFDKRLDNLTDRLSRLESDREKLKKKLDSTCESYGIPIPAANTGAFPSSFGSSFSATVSSSLLPVPTPFILLGMIVDARKRKRKEAELEGYEEARTTIFLPKISDMREKFAKIKQNSDQKIKEYLNLVEKCLSEIDILELQIVELRLMMD